MFHWTEDTSLIELSGNKTRDYYLDLAKDWIDPLGLPKVSRYKTKDGRILSVVRDDIHKFGTKGRWGSLLMQKVEADTLVYVAPRTGFAPLSLAALASQFGKKLILFAPSSKEISEHQAKAIELGADMRFFRIAAMPNLNRMAKDFADEQGFEFLPLGLKHPLVTAAGVKTCQSLIDAGINPSEVWSVMSTGVLSRALQIGFDGFPVKAVAVARNIQQGERGNAEMYSSPYAFTKPVPRSEWGPHPSIPTYDMKAWPFMREHAKDRALFWNVAKDLEPATVDKSKVDSQREWKEQRPEDLTPYYRTSW